MQYFVNLCHVSPYCFIITYLTSCELIQSPLIWFHFSIIYLILVGRDCVFAVDVLWEFGNATGALCGYFGLAVLLLGVRVFLG